MTSLVTKALRGDDVREPGDCQGIVHELAGGDIGLLRLRWWPCMVAAWPRMVPVSVWVRTALYLTGHQSPVPPLVMGLLGVSVLGGHWPHYSGHCIPTTTTDHLPNSQLQRPEMTTL